MRKSRRLVVALAVSSLVAAGGITAGLVANANTAAFCNGSGTPVSCTISDRTIVTPSAIQVNVKLQTGAAQTVTITWTAVCIQGSHQATTTSPATPVAQAITAGAEVTDTLTLGFTNPDSCTVTTTATLSSTGTFFMSLTWTPASTPSPTPSPTTSSSSPPPTQVSLIRGFGGKCLDAKGNSSANRTPVIIWTCNNTDKAQGWTYRNGELVHNGKCANDQGNGGKGSKVILWTCNRSSNELWFHSSSNGEFILSGTAHGLLCLDDPGSSRRNGTQLIVWTCHNTSNQHWS